MAAIARSDHGPRSSPAWRRWVRRYAPAEVVGTVAAVSAGSLAAPIGGPAAVAIVASWAEAVGFYATMAARDLSRRLRGAPSGSQTRLHAAAATTTALVAEFGAAEVIDTLLVRPALIAASLQLSPTPLVGILAGKVLADLAFYIPAIASWELLRRRSAEPAHGSIGRTEVPG